MMWVQKLMAGIMLSGVILVSGVQLVEAQTKSPSPSPSGPPKPAFTLNAGVGKFPPGSPLAFMDNVVNNVKLFFKFSPDAKITKRMDIADKDMVHMKMALEDGNIENLQT